MGAAGIRLENVGHTKGDPDGTRTFHLATVSTLVVGTSYHLGNRGSPPCGLSSSSIDQFPYVVVLGNIPRHQRPKLQGLGVLRSRTCTTLFSTNRSKIQGVGKRLYLLTGSSTKYRGYLSQSATQGGAVVLLTHSSVSS